MTLTAASPLTEQIYARLQDASLQAATNGRISDSPPQDVALPFVWIEIFDETDDRGFGNGPALPQVTLRTHVFTQTDQLRIGQGINTQVVALLKDATLSSTGFKPAGTIVYRSTFTAPNEAISGQMCHEVISEFTVWQEELAS